MLPKCVVVLSRALTGVTMVLPFDFFISIRVGNLFQGARRSSGVSAEPGKELSERRGKQRWGQNQGLLQLTGD